jgi:DNA-binding response OmpR family regulator
VTQSGGTIAVESEVGRGTAVHVLLRREPAPAEAEPDAPTAAAPARGHETILLVEDQAEVRAVSRAALTRHGYRVLEASYGEEALAIALRDDAAIDLMLTDVVMPGMSGRELATRVLAHRPGLRVLFASGYAEDVIAHHGVLESGVAFIQKPFAADGLLRRVRALLDDAG